MLGIGFPYGRVKIEVEEEEEDEEQQNYKDSFLSTLACGLCAGRGVVGR